MAKPGTGSGTPSADPSADPSAGSAGPGEALADLYAAHWVSLVRLAYLLVRDRGWAEEITQDVFVAAYPRLSRLREDGTALAYLRRSVVNGARSGFRHARVEKSYLGTTAAGADAPGRRPADSAEAVAIGRDDNARVLEVVNRLPQRQREVVVLRYYADLTEQQIADALGVSTGSVKAHAHRAMATLRSSWGEPS